MAISKLEPTKVLPRRTEGQKYKSDFQSVSLFLLFWLTAIVLTPAYIWTFILIIQWSTNLPFMIIYTALKLQLFSLAIGVGFVPFAFLLRHWFQGTPDKNVVCVKVSYSLLCILSISLAISAFLIIEDYKEQFFVYKEYKHYTEVAIKNGEFPSWATDNFGTDCCGWNGPLDFGQEFNLTQFVQRGDKTVMDQVAKCYNDLFEVIDNAGTTANEKLIFGPFKHISELPVGCSEKILTKTRETCYFIAFASLTNIVLTILTLLVYIIPCPSCNQSQVLPISTTMTNKIKNSSSTVVTLEAPDGSLRQIKIKYYRDNPSARSYDINGNYIPSD